MLRNEFLFVLQQPLVWTRAPDLCHRLSWWQPIQWVIHRPCYGQPVQGFGPLRGEGRTFDIVISGIRKIEVDALSSKPIFIKRRQASIRVDSRDESFGRRLLKKASRASGLRSDVEAGTISAIDQYFDAKGLSSALLDSLKLSITPFQLHSARTKRDLGFVSSTLGYQFRCVLSSGEQRTSHERSLRRL